MLWTRKNSNRNVVMSHQQIDFGQEYDSVNVQNVTQECDQYDDSKWFAFDYY